ncbi:MAG: NADP-dependent phosphogluconate dehydrogenase [Rhodospirillales bacterium]|nr:NADP-dependent phosphogluconate dehydrogenase [Rhodospirillales bacterium]
MTATADIGLVGLAVMGQNLVLNMADHGYTVAVFNRTTATMQKFVDSEAAAGKTIVGCETMEDLVANLKRPRAIVLMVKAGDAVDAQIEMLRPLLEEGDIIIDGGNSNFRDTQRRDAELTAAGLHFMGTGISGGEEGARFGPSIMPGGTEIAYQKVGPIFQAISAKVDDEPCCVHIGADGAGHFVKTTHNGIEYADMQMIAEVYQVMRHLLGMSSGDMAATFTAWNQGDLDSYLIEITADILGQTDEDTGQPMVEVILDKAGQKGTGQWTSVSALELGVPAPTIAEAVFARNITALKDERVAAEQTLGAASPTFDGDKSAFVDDLRDALLASKICAYAQGFALMQAAKDEFGWTTDFGEVSMIWRGGCIIRARFLNRIKEAYDRDPGLKNLLLDPYFRSVVEKGDGAWRRVVSTAIANGLPVPALTSALSYYDAYRSGRLWADLIQAQRDYFGAHTFERTDREGWYHREWMKT